MFISRFRHRYIEILIVLGIIAATVHLLSGQSSFISCVDVAVLVFLGVMLGVRRRSQEAD